MARMRALSVYTRVYVCVYAPYKVDGLHAPGMSRAKSRSHEGAGGLAEQVLPCACFLLYVRDILCIGSAELRNGGITVLRGAEIS